MNISNEDKQALIDGVATIPYKINIIQNGTIIKTLDDRSIVDIDYEDFRYVNTESLVIGQFVARKVTGNLDQLYDEFEIEDTEIELQMGISYYVEENNEEVLQTTYYSLGNFLVTKPSSDDVKDKTSFEAMDYAKKFNIVFDGTTLQYPCTALELATECCRQAGVTLGTLDFTNYDFVIPNNQYVENETCRKVMQDIGKLAYSWVRIDCDNKCYIDFDYGTTVDTYNTITTHNYYDLSLQKKVFGPVNRVVIGMRDVEGENAVIEDAESIEEYGVTEIQLYDNNITYTPELRQAAISSATKLFGLMYTPLEVNTTGHPWLIGNEKIEVIDGAGNSWYTYPFDRTIVYSGHIKTKLTSKADTKTETEYKNYGDLETEVRKTRIVVDKQEQEIQALASKIVELVNTTEDVGEITLENAFPGELHNLEIRGNISLVFPNDSTKHGNPVIISDDLIVNDDLYVSSGIPYVNKDTLYPSNTLYPKDTYLQVDDALYKLDFDYLNYISETAYDKYVYEDGKQWIERNVGIDENGQLYELENTVIENKSDLSININENSTITLLSFSNAILRSEYFINNNYTDTFATKVYVDSEITVAVDEITAEVNAKVDEDEIVAKLNLGIRNGQGVVELVGNTVTIESDNFTLEEDGSIQAKNGSFSGDIFLANGGKVIGGDGLLSNLQFNSVGIIDGWSPLGFNIDADNPPNVMYQDLYVDYNIPDNFTIVSATLTLYCTKVMSDYMNDSYQSIETTGTPQQLKLYQGTLNKTRQIFWANGTSYFYRNDLSLGSEISNAFGSSSYTPSISSVGDVAVKDTIDLTNILSTTSGNNQLVVRTNVTKPSNYTTVANRQTVAEKTGMARLVLNIIGYMSIAAENRLLGGLSLGEPSSEPISGEDNGDNENE